MGFALEKFVSDWNVAKKRDGVKFFLSWPEPISISVRYPTFCIQQKNLNQGWMKLNQATDSLSNGTAFIMSTEKMFRCGIIELKIATESNNYKDAFVVNLLKWIGTELSAFLAGA